MRVLLASPESEVWTSRKHIPLGLGYLASVLRENGHKVGLYDSAIEDESLETVVRREGYDLIGISAVTPLIVDAWNMAKEAKRLGLITVLGGPHLTLMPEESISAEHPEVDYVIQGEAEESLVEFVDALEGRLPMELVHGLFWRQRRRDGRQRAVAPGAEPRHHPLSRPRSVQDHPLHQSQPAHRRAGHQSAGLHDHDQPRLPVQVHLLLEADHRRHVAAQDGGERRRRMALAGP